jgi:pimeloyl-ACP methyl ester carboxylesterase
MLSPTWPARSRHSLSIDHARIGGHSVRYAVRPGDPDRTPLLFLNGLGANIELALPFIDALATPTVVIFDVPGVGGSPTPPSPYRPSSVAKFAAIARSPRVARSDAGCLVGWRDRAAVCVQHPSAAAG